MFVNDLRSFLFMVLLNYVCSSFINITVSVSFGTSSTLVTYPSLPTVQPLASVSSRVPSITVTETPILPGRLYMSPPPPAVSWVAAALSQRHGFLFCSFVLFPLLLFPPACHTIFCWASLANGPEGLKASRPRLTSLHTKPCKFLQHFF